MTKTATLAVVLLSVASAALAAGGAQPETLVLLPFANIAGAQRGPSVIELALTQRLSEKGYKIVRGDEVRAFLAAERVRYLDSLAGPVREKLLAKFSAHGAVLGAICAFDEGEDPVVGVSIRLVGAEGGSAWSDAVGLTADDMEGALGLKRIHSVDVLADKVADRLIARFPAPGRSSKIAKARAVPIGLSSPRTYRSMELGSGEHRVLVLPLANASRERIASRLVGELLVRRLSASDLFEPVEPSDFRAAMVSAKLAGLKNGDPAELARLGKALGTSFVLTGTVYRYRDTSSKNPGLTPQLDLELTLTDVAAGRVLWTSSVSRNGTDYSGLFQLGLITNMTALADQVAGEMVRAAEKAHGKGPKPGVTAARSTRAPSRAALDSRKDNP